MAQGLSSYNVRKIIKDKNGFLWVGTQYGLSRFDGKQFVNFSNNGTLQYRLCGIDIRGLIEDTTRDMLWVLPGGSGFDGIDLRSSHVVTEASIKDENAEEFRISMELLQNCLWIGSSTGLRVFNIASGTFEKKLYRPVDPTNVHELEASYLFSDHYGNLWCFYSDYGIVIYNGKTKEKIKEYRLDPSSKSPNAGTIVFNNCISLTGDQLLVCTSEGLRGISFDAAYNISVDNAPCKCLPGLNTESVEAICKTRNGTLLVASHSQLYRLNASLRSCSIIRETETNLDGDWLSSVQYIYCDEHDNTWLGCEQGLAFIYSEKSPFKPFYLDKTNNERLDHVRSIFVMKNGDVLAGLRNGIAHIDIKTGRYSIADKEHTYHHIYEDKEGRVHAAREDRMFIYSEGRITPVEKYYPEFEPYKSYPINSHLLIGDSLVVLGTENDKGILLWNSRSHTVRQIWNKSADSLASNVVNNIYLDKKGRVWVLSDRVATILSSGFTKTTALDIVNPRTKRNVNLLFDMCEAGGSYWIAAYGTGLIQLDTFLNEQKIFSTQSGLSDNCVYQVYPVGDKLVITSDKGLSVFNIANQTFKRYYQEDGLHSSSFEEVAGIMKDGLIYAGGVKGFSIIDPVKFSTDTIPPRIYINHILVDRANQSKDIDTTNIDIRALDVPNDVLQTTLWFSGINYSNPQRTTFAYRIKETNPEWVNIGTQNYINLVGLAPGTYHVEMKAANENDIWSKPVTVVLTYQPKWYQTWWFNISLWLLLALIPVITLFIIYRIRVRNIMKEQEIRKDVAADLHDDIGSTLNITKLFAHMSKAEPAKVEYIHKVEENLEEAIIGLRDMMWILDDKYDSIDDLRQRVNQFFDKLADKLHIKVHFSISDGKQFTSLPKLVKRNLFLIIKEAINNSVKYAHCRNIYIDFRLRAKKLEVSIRDDGKGFEAPSDTEGYGLSNIKRRASQINFDCSIQSGATGTQITLVRK